MRPGGREYCQEINTRKAIRRRRVNMAEEVQVGSVIQFFAKPCVAAVEITSGTLSVGDAIRISGTTTDFEQKIESMEIDRTPVQSATVGQSVGIKVKDRVRPHDKVFKLAV
jgi:translation initiation factor IF-2